MTVIIAAEEAAGVRTVRSLADQGVDIVAVLTSQATEAGRGAAVADVARHYEIPIWPAELVREARLAKRLREKQVDLLLNVHSLFVVCAEVAAAPRIGSFNLHPGPLPSYAGLNAPSWAIVNGERRHAVTLHWMDSGVDTGDIAYESWFEIADDDTGLTVSAKCVVHGLPLIQQLLETGLSAPEAIPSDPQDLSLRRVYKRDEVPFDGVVDWHRSTGELVDFVRASDYYPMQSPWGHPRTWLDGQEIGIVSASAGASGSGRPGTVVHRDGGVQVASGDGWVAVRRINLAGHHPSPPEVLIDGAILGPS